MWQGNNTTAEDPPGVTWAADAAATPTPRTVTVLLLAPVWPDIRSQLKWGFLLHTYGFACLFFVLAFYAFFSILNLRSLISARPFMSSINGFLCLLGISRAGCLLIDPYNLKEAMPRVMGSVLWDVGFPCIASAFCLIQLAFLQLTQLKIGPERMRRKSCLSLVITAHFTCIIGADIAVGFQEHLTIAKYVMQTLFLCWAAFLSLVSLYGAFRVLSLLKRVPGVGFQRDRSHKGIMQLALLAPYGNLAAALGPTLLSPPKIRVTDEHDHTVSVASTPQAATSDGCPPPTLMVRPPTPTLVGGATSPGTSRRRCSDVAGNNSSSSRRPSDAFPRAGAGGSRRSSQVCHPSSRPVSPTPGCSRSNTFTASSSPRRSLGNANSRRGMSLGGAHTGPHGDISEDETTAETSLLQHPASSAGSTRRGKNSRMLQVDPPPSPTPSASAAPSASEGLTLHSILAHIAYRSSGAADAMCGGGMDGRGSGGALKGVVRATVCTALLLLLLAIGEAARAMGPYGAFAVRGKVEYSHREDVSLLSGSPRPWPWFCFQTACRALEFAIGCAMASITRQPARREQIPPRAYYSLRLESLYI